MTLDLPIEKTKGISLVYKKNLKRLEITTLKDLLFYFPSRYEDRRKITSIAKAKINDLVCIRGKILEIQNRRTPLKKIILTEAIVQDKSGAIKIVWFNQPYLINNLQPGQEALFFGKVVLGETGTYLSSPSYERADKKELLHTKRIVPIYPETQGISSRWLRFKIHSLLKTYSLQIKEVIPSQILKRYHLLSLPEALWEIHFPSSIKEAEKAKKRFAFENLFLISLFVLKQRGEIDKQKSFSIETNLTLIKKFINSLPFSLTYAQKRASWEILRDLNRTRPMNRLLEGDVGSGKTIVALIAALNVISSQYQVAFMAPTEILALQHFQTAIRFLKKHPYSLALLTRSQAQLYREGIVSVSKKEIISQTKQGKINLLIGTHSLIQKEIKFNRLALVILDEQHRFGVKQRAALVSKEEKKIPHLLSMTATPIPRTLALTFYGDLDLSLLDELPKGRKKIITKIVFPLERKKVYQFLDKELKKGRQAFVICPRIEKPEEQKLKRKIEWQEAKAVKEEYKKLKENVFPDFQIGILYGRMKPKEKEKTIKEFQKGKINILVCTSVVEVGIDIPNATIMLIEGAEYFGLAQLYQFRGRIGRGKHQSYCFLVLQSSSKKSKQRLKALLKAKNGFELAEKDLQLRGPGEFLGKRQSGLPDFVMEALKDIQLVKQSRQAAKGVLSIDPDLEKFPLLKEKISAFQEKVHLE